MDFRFRFALDEALGKAHALLRQTAGWLAPVMRRAERRRARDALRLAEDFLRRAILLLSTGFDEALTQASSARHASRARAHRPAPSRPRGFRLTEPPARCRPASHLPAGRFETLGDQDEVPAEALMARHRRLQAALADPVSRARRLALWRRRARKCGRQPLRARLVRPRPVGAPARLALDWLREIDRLAREALTLGPG